MNGTTLKAQMGRLRHGTHVCAFYRDLSEAASIMAPWAGESLVRGERCLYVADDSSRAGMVRALLEAGVDVDRPAFTFLSRHDWRHPGTFDPDVMARRVMRLVDSALSDSPGGLWLAVEMAWTREPDISAEAVARWEGKWNDLLAGMPLTLLCLYGREQFAPAFLKPEVNTHPFVIHAGELYPSCYYQRLFTCPTRHASDDLDGALEHIREHTSGPPRLPTLPASLATEAVAIAQPEPV